MGQQQLLLIVLGVIIVGIAIVVGINMFQSSAIDSNRNAVAKDLLTLASKAQEYYKKPPPLGGGGTTFAGFTIPTGMASNPNGTYSITAAGTATGITFQGVGTETGNDGSTKVKVTAVVSSTSQTPTVTINN
jgi:Tfp pilus assembly protein PilE